MQSNHIVCEPVLFGRSNLGYTHIYYDDVGMLGYEQQGHESRDYPGEDNREHYLI